MEISDLTPSNTTDTMSWVTSPLKAIAQAVPSLLRTYQRNDEVWNDGMCLKKMLTDQMSCVAWQPSTVPRVAGHVHLCGNQKLVFSFLFPIDWAQNVERWKLVYLCTWQWWSVISSPKLFLRIQEQSNISCFEGRTPLTIQPRPYQAQSGHVGSPGLDTSRALLDSDKRHLKSTSSSKEYIRYYAKLKKVKTNMILWPSSLAVRSGHDPHELHQSLCGRDPATSAQRPSVLDCDEVDHDHDFVK